MNSEKFLKRLNRLKNTFYNNDEGFKDNNSNFSENTITSRTDSKYKYIPQNSYQNDDDFWYQSNSNKTSKHFITINRKL